MTDQTKQEAVSESMTLADKIRLSPLLSAMSERDQRVVYGVLHAKFSQQAVESERDRALEQAANICDEYEDLTGTEKDSALLVGEVALSIAMSGEPRAARFLAEQIRALKSQQPAQADKPDIESTHAARAIAAYEASGATTPWTHLDPGEWSKWEKIADAVHALSKG